MSADVFYFLKSSVINIHWFQMFKCYTELFPVSYWQFQIKNSKAPVKNKKQ